VGDFIEVDGLNTGRFLDPPEFTVFHDKGNEQNLFDRVDYNFTSVDSIHVDLNYSRSWFQTPNSYDNLNVQNVVSAARAPAPLSAVSATRSTLQDRNIQYFTHLHAYHRQLLSLQPWSFRPPR